VIKKICQLFEGAFSLLFGEEREREREKCGERKEKKEWGRGKG
jgi:hypothetical protein